MSFSTIQYQTAYGENCVATKKDGIVTIQGDKHGVRQMELSEFMQAFIKDQSKVSLERTPKNDTVAFKGTQGVQEQISQKYTNEDLKNVDNKYKTDSHFWSSSYTVTGDNVNLKVKEGFLGGRTVKGTINGKSVDLKLISDFGIIHGDKTKISGKIGNNDVNLNLKPKLNMWGAFKEGDLSGEINSADKGITPLLATLARDKYMNDVECAMAAM